MSEARRESEYVCPHCGGGIQISDQDATLVLCPDCGQAVHVAAQAGTGDSFAVIDDEPPPGDDSNDRLDMQRVRRIATMHKAVVKSRSHATLGLVLSGFLGVQFMIVAGAVLRDAGSVKIAVISGTAGLVCLCFAHHFWTNLRRTRPSPPGFDVFPETTPPEPPPDFSTLSDGSQRVKNLEDVR